MVNIRKAKKHSMKTALTFFSGAGGMCAGLAQAGFEIIGGNEWDGPIADIWDANHHGLKCDRRSILDIPIEDLPYADLYHFSPPCKAHSQSNPNRRTGTDEEDTAIAEKIASIIIHGRIPRWVTLENVPMYRKSRSWHIIESALSVAGYRMATGVVNAHNFGNPQKRHRFIVRAGLQGFGPLMPNAKKTFWNDVLLSMPSNSLRATKLSKGQAKKFSLTQPLSGFYLAQRTGYSIKTGPQIFRAGQPCLTITSAMAHDGKKNKNGLPSFRSPVTIVVTGDLSTAWEVRARGLAALQGFPDDWQWAGAEVTAAIAIGNAVPVQLAKAIGESLQCNTLP
jgi:DNA (cytosine-5)-methyltransferase 1